MLSVFLTLALMGNFLFAAENFSENVIENILPAPSEENAVELFVHFDEQAKEKSAMISHLTGEYLQSVLVKDFSQSLSRDCLEIEEVYGGIKYTVKPRKGDQNSLHDALHLLAKLFDHQMTHFDEMSAVFAKIFEPENASLSIDAESMAIITQEIVPVRFGNKISVPYQKNLMAATTNKHSVAPAAKETKGSQIEAFYTLDISDVDKDNVTNLITKLADRNVFQLLRHKREMNRLGDKVNHLHPLRFIGYIFSRQDLTKNMWIVHQSGFKWRAFAEGFSGGMQVNAKKNNLLIYVPGFCHETKADEQIITKLIEKQQWEAVLMYFIRNVR